MNKGISIVTSFGCPYDCWYCIMKQHSLYKYEGEFDYKKLKQFLVDNKDTSELSISGGGDPLNEFKEHRDFYYNFVFPAIKDIGFKNMDGVDIHTRLPLYEYDFWKQINRCVFSIDFVNTTDRIKNISFIRWIYENKLWKLRLFHCVLPTTTDNDIELLVKLGKELNCQVSIKQLHGFDDKGRFKQISKKYPELFQVYDKNYLTYYMPNNTVTDTFMF